MKNLATNYPISTSDFRNQCKKLLLEKVESKELDLTKEQILKLQINIIYH